MLIMNVVIIFLILIVPSSYCINEQVILKSKEHSKNGNTIYIFGKNIEITVVESEHNVNYVLDKTIKLINSNLVRKKRSPQGPPQGAATVRPVNRGSGSSRPGSSNRQRRQRSQQRQYQQRVRNATAVALQRYAQRVQQNVRRLVGILRGRQNNQPPKGSGGQTGLGGAAGGVPPAKQALNQAETKRLNIITHKTEAFDSMGKDVQEQNHLHSGGKSIETTKRKYLKKSKSPEGGSTSTSSDILTGTVLSTCNNQEKQIDTKFPEAEENPKLRETNSGDQTDGQEGSQPQSFNGSSEQAVSNSTEKWPQSNSLGNNEEKVVNQSYCPKHTKGEEPKVSELSNELPENSSYDKSV